MPIIRGCFCNNYFTRSPQPILDYSLLPRLRHLDYLFAFRRPQSPLQSSVMDGGKNVVPGIGCLPAVGLKGILASSGGDSRSRSWVPYGATRVSADPHIALSLQVLARRVGQFATPGGKRVPNQAKVRSDYVHHIRPDQGSPFQKINILAS